MKNFLQILQTLIIFEQWICSSMGVSLASPFLISDSQANVNFIAVDYEGKVFVALDNGLIQKFDSSLVTFTILSLGVTANELQFGSLTYAIVLLDSSQLAGNARCLISKDSLGFGLSVFDYSTYVMKENYTLNESIQSFHVFPLNSGSITSYLIVVLTSKSIKVLYQGLERWVLQYSTFAGPGVTLSSCAFKNEDISTPLINSLLLSARFHISLSNKFVYYLDIRTSVSYNATTGQFDFQISQQTIAFLQAYTDQISFIGFQNGILLEQESTGTIRSFYTDYNLIVSVNSAIPIFQIQDFLFINNSYYLLQNNAMIEISFVTLTINSFQWQLTSILSTMPTNVYHIVFITNDLALIYASGSPYVYKSGKCQDYTVFINGSCQTYQCSDVMCISCPITPDVCGACALGYAKSTFNNTCESSTSLNNTNLAFNSSNTSSQQEKPIIPFTQLFEKIQITFIDTIQIPGARRLLTPVFFYFGHFDDLYLYQFHNKTYGPTMKYVFSLISDVQTSKWNLFGIETLFEVDYSDFWTQLANFQSAYLLYANQQGKQLGSEGLLANSFNFFTILIPITIVGFLLCRFVWYFTRSCRVSQFLRQFSCGLFLFLLLFEGNIQQFSFYLSAEFTHLFYMNAGHAFFKVGITIFGFIVVFVPASGMLLSLAIYRKVNRCLMENYKNNVYGVLWLTLLTGLRNIILGAMQYFLRRLSYYFLLLTLLLFECLYAGCLVYLISEKKVFRYRGKVWLILLLTFLRILLFALFFIDNQSLNSDIVQLSQQVLICLMVLVFLIGFMHQIFISLLELAKKMKSGGILKREQSANKKNCEITIQMIKDETTMSKKIFDEVRIQEIQTKTRSGRILQMKSKKQITPNLNFQHKNGGDGQSVEIE